MGRFVKITGKRNFRARTGRYCERESIVEVKVNSKRLIREGNEEITTAVSGSKCHHNNHLVKAGEELFVLGNRTYCKSHWYKIPDLKTVQYEFRRELGYEVDIN